MKFDCYALADLAQIKYGKNQANVRDPEGSIPIYGTGGIMEYAREALYSGPSVLIGRKGTIDKVQFLDKPFWCVDTTFYTIVDESKINPRYLYHVLSQYDLSQYDEGTTIPSLRTETLNQLEFDVPSIDDQKRILRIINPLDDKIRVLSQINDNLDQQLKRLFKRLFSDNTSIPLGRLGCVCDVQKGLSYKGEGLTEDGIPMINLGNVVPGGGYRQDKNKTYSGEYKQKNIVKPGDLIIANTDMTYERVILGSPLIVPDYQGDILFTHHLFALRDVKLPRSYLYYYLRTEDFHGLCEASANGTTVLAITKEDVLDAVMPLPPTDLLDRFTSVADPYLAIMSNNDKECKQLKEIRDYLLPKLMSGEIDVSTLEIPN